MKKLLVLLISILGVLVALPFTWVLVPVLVVASPVLLLVGIVALIWHFNREEVSKPTGRHIVGVVLCVSIVFMPYGIALVTDNKISWVTLVLCLSVLLWPVAFVKETNRCLRFHKSEMPEHRQRELAGVLLCMTGWFAPIGVALLRNKKPEMLGIIFLLNVVMFTWPVALILAFPHRETPFLAFNQPYENNP